MNFIYNFAKWTEQTERERARVTAAKMVEAHTTIHTEWIESDT